jgi:glucuronokinase
VSPPSQLVAAAVRRFARRHPAALDTAVEWTTSIPRGVGLGGSSAIVIATLRALVELHSVVLPESELAAMALAVEAEDLGIAAGPQDRVAQAYGGLTFMDFGEAQHHYEQLDPCLLPALLVAWRADAGDDSGPLHSDLRTRFNRGEPIVRRSVAQLARFAHDARGALLDGDQRAFARCVDGSFDARRQMMALDLRHVQMIEIARSCGSSANYTGSGGAIIAVCRDDRHRRVVATALEQAGCGTIRVVGPA